MNNRIITFLALSLFGIVSQGVSAAPVTFNFDEDETPSFTSGSITFTGTDATTTLAASAGNAGNSHISFLKDSSWGLLVCTGGSPSSPQSNGSCGSTSDHHYIDGGSDNSSSDPDEYVSLDFGQNVSLVSASFYSSSSGDFDLFADGTSVLNEKPVGNLVSLAGIDGSVFRFLADGPGDDFKLRALTVEVSEVPLPAAAWLFTSALLGLGAISRRTPGNGIR